MVGTSNKSDVGVAIEWRVPIHGTQLVGSENPMDDETSGAPINSMKDAMAIHGAPIICYSHAMINTQGASIGIISI